MGPQHFERLVRSVSDKMYRFALRMLGDADDAKDTVQEALLRLWRHRERLDGLESPEAWCLTVTRNLCLDRFKSARARRETGPRPGAEPAEAGPTPYHALEQKDQLRELRLMIAALPEKQRMILHLREIEALSYKEIASVLSLSMEDVKVGLFRARRTLKENLSKHMAYGLPRSSGTGL